MGLSGPHGGTLTNQQGCPAKVLCPAILLSIFRFYRFPFEHDPRQEQKSYDVWAEPSGKLSQAKTHRSTLRQQCFALTANDQHHTQRPASTLAHPTDSLPFPRPPPFAYHKTQPSAMGSNTEGKKNKNKNKKHTTYQHKTINKDHSVTPLVISVMPSPL